MPSVPQPPPAPRSSPMINMNILLYIFAHIFAVHSAVHICFLFVFHFIILKIFYISISFLWFFKEKKNFPFGFLVKISWILHTHINFMLDTNYRILYLLINKFYFKMIYSIFIETLYYLKIYIILKIFLFLYLFYDFSLIKIIIFPFVCLIKINNEQINYQVAEYYYISFIYFTWWIQTIKYYICLSMRHHGI